MRLESIEPRLAEEIKKSGSELQRRVALLACRFAMNAAPVGNSIAAQALLVLEIGQRFTEEQLAKLNNLQQELDDRYFDLQEQAEDDAEKQVEALQYFGQARAVSALLFSQDSDPLVASMEAVYEASSTTDRPADLFDAVTHLLAGH